MADDAFEAVSRFLMTRNGTPSRPERDGAAEFWGIDIDEILQHMIPMDAVQEGGGNGFEPPAAPHRAPRIPPSARVVPAPTKPMGVARELLKDLYTYEDGRLLLRAHGGALFFWSGTCWPEFHADSLDSVAYKFLENAVYEKKENELVPFDPTKSKIENVCDALKAIVLLDGDLGSPAWINDPTVMPLAHEMVSMKNCLLHVPTRTPHSHTPDFFVHHSLPFPFDPDAPPPTRWQSFLHELWPNDDDSVATLQEIMGYLLAGGTTMQKIFLLVGPRRSGKGTIGRVLTGLLGRYNIVAPTLSSLSTTFGLSPLIGKPLAIVSDARLSAKTDNLIVVERLLTISGEDSITIDRKYRKPWTGHLPTRFLILTNELPGLSDSSGALASRFILLRLTRSFLGKENPKLTDELLSEAPSILNWALDGLDRLTARRHFALTELAQEDLRQLDELGSPIRTFLSERCELGADATCAVDELWGEFQEWCRENNQRPGTKALFGRDLKSAEPEVAKIRPRKGEDRKQMYQGIRLRSSTDSAES